MIYKDNNGNEYKGDVITLSDGRILSGKTYTKNSKRLDIHPPSDAQLAGEVLDIVAEPLTKPVSRANKRKR